MSVNFKNLNYAYVIIGIVVVFGAVAFSQMFYVEESETITDEDGDSETITKRKFQMPEFKKAA